MARSTTVVSSLPGDQPDDELPPEGDEIELMEGEEEELPQEEDNSPEAVEARQLGYASVEALETAATKGGWKPLAQYKGVAGGWKTAAQFIRAGQEYLPFVQKENRELKAAAERTAAELAALRDEVGTTQADMRKLLDFSRRAGKEAYERARRDILAEQRQAVVEGDAVAYDAAQQKLDAMEGTRVEVEAPAPEPVLVKPKITVEPEIDAFVRDNPWFLQSPVLNPAMKGAHNQVILSHPAMSLGDQLERAKQMVMRQYPEAFGIDPEEPAPVPQPPAQRPAAPRRPAAHTSPTVRQPSRQTQPAGDPDAPSIDSIVDPKARQQVRIAFNRFRQSLPDTTEAEYMAIYHGTETGEQTDVLEVRQRFGKPKGK